MLFTGKYLKSKNGQFYKIQAYFWTYNIENQFNEMMCLFALIKEEMASLWTPINAPYLLFSDETLSLVL